MYFNHFTQTDTRQAQVYGVLVCNLVCSSFHRFLRQEKDRLSCSALSNEDFCEAKRLFALDFGLINYHAIEIDSE